MCRLEQFQNRVERLGARHSDLWKTYDLSYAKRYNDPEIRKRDPEVVIEVDCLYHDWKDLRKDMEQFLESKGLPTVYPQYSWTRCFTGIETGTFAYDGSAIIVGFDYGPAMWCSNTLRGMTQEMYNRCHLQRIEMYSVLGFVIGIAGTVIGLIALFRFDLSAISSPYSDDSSLRVNSHTMSFFYEAESGIIQGSSLTFLVLNLLIASSTDS